jgi:phosphocarrier protein
MSKRKATGSFVIVNEKGLHTRPSTELVRCAASFQSQLVLHYQNSAVNAKSLLGILTLAAERGARIEVEAVGEDAEEAVKAIAALAGNGFNMVF